MRVSQGLAWLIILLPSPLPPLLIHLLLVLFPYDSLIILISLSILITIWKCLLNSAKCNRKYVAYCGRLFVEKDSNLRRYNGLELIQRSMGVHPPEAMIHFPLFQISPIFSTNFQTVENLKNVTFSRQIFRFSSAKISDDLFLVIDHKFPVSVHFPSVSRNKYYSPLLLTNFPLVFEKVTGCLHTLCVFRLPLLLPWCIYASPNARTGRPCKEARYLYDSINQSNLRLFRPPLTQTQRGLLEHKKVRKQNK